MHTISSVEAVFIPSRIFSSYPLKICIFLLTF